MQNNDQKKYLWWQDGIIYQVYPRSFQDTNGDGVGDLRGVIQRLDYLKWLGVKAIWLSPIYPSPMADFGYDISDYENIWPSFGDLNDFDELTQKIHAAGMKLILDLVPNHSSDEHPWFVESRSSRDNPKRNWYIWKDPKPDGSPPNNWLSVFGGSGWEWDERTKQFYYHAFLVKQPDLNWRDSEVVDAMLNTMRFWLDRGVDGFRVDAMWHMVKDGQWRDNPRNPDYKVHMDAVKRWQQLNGRSFYLIAESDGNDPRTVRPTSAGGLGFDAQWLDDFHHSLYVLLDPGGIRHYEDFGRLDQLAKAYTEGFVHSNEYVRFRHRRHGSSSAGLSGDKFIVFNQNHDIPGNRPGGERLSVLVDLPRLKLAAAAILLSPYLPMLFMGEEYGEKAPFYFFSDYSDPEIIRGLSSRKQDFASFNFEGDLQDPQSEQTFITSRINWDQRTDGDHATLLEWHRQLISLRRTNPLLKDCSKNNFRADLLGNQGLALYRHGADQSQYLLCILNLSPDPLTASIPLHPTAGSTIHLPPWGVSIQSGALQQLQRSL